MSSSPSLLSAFATPPLYSLSPSSYDSYLLPVVSLDNSSSPSPSYHPLSASPYANSPMTSSHSAASPSPTPYFSLSSSISDERHLAPAPSPCQPSSTPACLSVSTVPRLLHPFFSSSDLLSHSAALFTLSDLLALSTLNRCIAALARSERIWRPRIQAAIAIRYPAAAQFPDDDQQDEQKQQQQLSPHYNLPANHPPLPQHHQQATVRFTCPYLSAMQQSRSDQRSSLSSLPHLISANPFVSDLVQQLEASTAKDDKQKADVTATSTDAAQNPQMASAPSSTVTVLSSLAVPLFYSASSSTSSSSPASALSSKARYLALCQCSLHSIAGCSRLVAPLPPLPAPSTQAYWAHTRVLLYPAPPSLHSCDPLPTLPLCADCRASLAVCMKDYYDYRGEWAGQFTMTPLSIVIVHPPDTAAAAAANERPTAVLDVRYSHLGGYDGIDHRRFEVEYIKAGHNGCTCGCVGMSAGTSSTGEWSVRVMHRYRSGIYAMDSPLNVVSNDRLEYSHLRERERHVQRKRKGTVAVQHTPLTQSTLSHAR